MILYRQVQDNRKSAQPLQVILFEVFWAAAAMLPNIRREGMIRAVYGQRLQFMLIPPRPLGMG